MRTHKDHGAEIPENQVMMKSGKFKGRGRGYYLIAKLVFVGESVREQIMAPLFLGNDEQSLG